MCLLLRLPFPDIFCSVFNEACGLQNILFNESYEMSFSLIKMDRSEDVNSQSCGMVLDDSNLTRCFNLSATKKFLLDCWRAIINCSVFFIAYSNLNSISERMIVWLIAVVLSIMGTS